MGDIVSSIDVLCDAMSMDIPNVDDDNEVIKQVYYAAFGENDTMMRGKYYSCVTPHGVKSDPKSVASSWANYGISVYLFYFLDSNDDLRVKTQGFLTWSNSVFDVFHLSTIGGRVNYCHCDFVMYPSEYRELGNRVIVGEIQCDIRGYKFK